VAAAGALVPAIGDKIQAITSGFTKFWLENLDTLEDVALSDPAGIYNFTFPMKQPDGSVIQVRIDKPGDSFDPKLVAGQLQAIGATMDPHKMDILEKTIEFTASQLPSVLFVHTKINQLGKAGKIKAWAERAMQLRSTTATGLKRSAELAGGKALGWGVRPLEMIYAEMQRFGRGGAAALDVIATAIGEGAGQAVDKHELYMGAAGGVPHKINRFAATVLGTMGFGFFQSSARAATKAAIRIQPRLSPEKAVQELGKEFAKAGQNLDQKHFTAGIKNAEEVQSLVSQELEKKLIVSKGAQTRAPGLQAAEGAFVAQSQLENLAQARIDQDMDLLVDTMHAVRGWTGISRDHNAISRSVHRMIDYYYEGIENIMKGAQGRVDDAFLNAVDDGNLATLAAGVEGTDRMLKVLGDEMFDQAREAAPTLPIPGLLKKLNASFVTSKELSKELGAVPLANVLQKFSSLEQLFSGITARLPKAGPVPTGFVGKAKKTKLKELNFGDLIRTKARVNQELASLVGDTSVEATKARGILGDLKRSIQGTITDIGEGKVKGFPEEVAKLVRIADSVYGEAAAGTTSKTFGAFRKQIQSFAGETDFRPTFSKILGDRRTARDWVSVFSGFPDSPLGQAGQLQRFANPEAIEAMRREALLHIKRSHIGKGQTTLTEGALSAWKEKNPGWSEIPGLAEDLDTLTTAVRSLDDAKVTAAGWRGMATKEGDILQAALDGQHPEAIVADIFSGRSRREQRNALRLLQKAATKFDSTVTGGTDAQTGLRQQVWDYFINEVASAENMPTKEFIPVLNPNAMREFVDVLGPDLAASGIMSTAQQKGIKTIADGVDLVFANPQGLRSSAALDPTHGAASNIGRLMSRLFAVKAGLVSLRFVLSEAAIGRLAAAAGPQNQKIVRKLFEDVLWDPAATDALMEIGKVGLEREARKSRFVQYVSNLQGWLKTTADIQASQGRPSLDVGSNNAVEDARRRYMERRLNDPNATPDTPSQLNSR
jgi:hypothetical protein